ncbi:MAG: hypothetical protein Q8932_21155, partial [Bacteroidota bacterium]|nr:hypothetical protein [Bacteroidota bacterium]
MKKALLLWLGTYCALLLFAQPSIQTSFMTGISLPVSGNAVNGTHAGSGIHFGNHLDYLMGNGPLRFGIGAYIGFLNGLGTNDKYLKTGQDIATRNGMQASQLQSTQSSFKSTHILLGPVASVRSGNWDASLWMKGGYGMNEPGNYAVVYKANGVVNNIYINQAGDNKNGLAYSLGGAIRFAISEYAGLQLAANYFGTQTDQVNYNFEREKGLAPLYSTASNAYLQASVGLVFTIGKITGKPEVKSAVAYDRAAEARNINKENRNGEQHSDSLYFSPERLTIKGTRQTQSPTFGSMVRTPMQSVNNYLTGFVYQGSKGPVLGQCGASEMASDPIPGVDVRLMCEGCSSPWLGRTNADGSFSISNIPPGNYQAVINKDTLAVRISNISGNNSGLSVLELPLNECSMANNILYAENKVYVEVISARETSSGMASGRRTLAGPSSVMTVTNTSFEVNWKNIISNEGKLYAEVMTAREASTGMATGRTLITGDLDGDGVAEYASVHMATEHGSGMASGLTDIVHLHKEGIIHRDLAARSMLTPDGGQNAGEAAVSNPLYQGSGSSGHNPFFESKDAIQVSGSNGVDHSLFLPSTLDLKTAVTANTGPGNSFDCWPIRWMPGSHKTDNNSNTLRASINTTRSNIKHVSRINCTGGSCNVECVVEMNGQ